MSNDPMKDFADVMRGIAAENKESEEADHKYTEQQFRKKFDNEDYEPTEEEIEDIIRKMKI